MSRILVIGGYGGFGSRLCRRLSRQGYRVLVSGRDYRRAARLAAELGEAEPLVLDRNDPDLTGLLANVRPDLVIDAAGPFQTGDHVVPRACIAAAIPYLDLADARRFVTAIETLDDQARAAGVAIVSGASSVPALSGAVVRRLARGLDRVEAIEFALSAANRASGGASVVAAILSYVGRPIRLWRGRRWTHGHGWQELRREAFIFADGTGLRRRLVALAEMPDLQLLPERLPGRPAIVFRAGTELGFQMRALWLASWLVRWGLIGSLAKAQPVLMPLYRLTLGIGGERSAMSVRLKGRVGDRRIERRWTVVAERGDGLEVPTLAAALLVPQVMEGRVAAGARDAGTLLSLDDFEPELARLSLRHETVERDLPPPLYARLMGTDFDRLPPAVRKLHDLCGDAGARGHGTVKRGRNRLVRPIAGIMRFPPSGSWPLHVAFAERDGIERWTRDFGGHCFSSELSAAGGRLVERFGPLRFVFSLIRTPAGLDMRLRRWTCLRIPLPLALAPSIAAREWEEDGRFRFDVRVSVPIAGDVVHYSGSLEPCP